MRHHLGFSVACIAVVTSGCAAETAQPSAATACIAAKGLPAPPAPAETTVTPDNTVDYALPMCPTGTVLKVACPAAPTIELHAFPQDAAHIGLPNAITYADAPPVAGDHRSEWAKWGEFQYLPPQRWLHNLEHGGVAILYDPCADPKLITNLRGLARCRPKGATGDFRWVMTPYAGLDTAWSIVAWQWRIKGNCFDATAIDSFLTAHYDKGPESVAANGGWTVFWMGK